MSKNSRRNRTAAKARARARSRGNNGPTGNRPADSRPAARPRPVVGQPTRPAPVEPSTGWRRTLEIRTGPLLIMLHTMPRWVLPVTMALILFLGLLFSGPWAWLGALLLGLIALFLAWLLALSWPMLSGSSRLIRTVVVLAVTGLAVLKAIGRW